MMPNLSLLYTSLGLTGGVNYCAWCLTYLRLFHQFFEMRYGAICSLTVTSKQYKRNKLSRLVNMTFRFLLEHAYVCVCVYCYAQACKAAIFSSCSFQRPFLFMFFFFSPFGEPKG